MKNIHKLLFISLLYLASCNMLDTEPYDFRTPDNYYSTEEEMKFALNGVYATLADATLYGGNLLGRTGLEADLAYESYSSDYGTVGDYDVAPTDTKILTYWRDLYDGIGRANLLLANIDKPEWSSQEARDRVYAEAVFLRAYYHFMLVVRFHNIPIILSVPDGIGVDQLQKEQSDPRTVYEYIVGDMEKVAPMLPLITEVASPERLNQSAAYGILAKACLYMAGYPVNDYSMYAKAREYSDKVISGGLHRLNPVYKDIFINLIQDKYDKGESLFEVGFYGNNEGTYTNIAGMLGRNNGIGVSNDNPVGDTGLSLVDMFGYSIGALRTTSWYYSLFETGDRRRDWNISPYTYSAKPSSPYVNPETGEVEQYKQNASSTTLYSRYCGKFRREYELTTPKATNYNSTNFPVLRYSDVLLVWAEAVAADPLHSDATELEQAVEYVNMVRRRAYGADVNVPNSTCDIENEGKALLFETIKDERAREFGFECTRKDDIVRWGEFNSRMRYIKSEIMGIDPSQASYTASIVRVYNNFSSRDEIWPIPSYEMGVNKKLKQNPGW